MTDRRQPPNAPQRVRAPVPATGAVRRNLFTSQLTRRPTTTSSNNSAETVRIDSSTSTAAAAAAAVAEPADALDDLDGEIVVRDQHGEIELADPPSPEMDEDEEGALDDGREIESAFGRCCSHGGPNVLTFGRRKAKARRRGEASSQSYSSG